MRILAGEITRGFDGLNDLVDETQRSFQLTEDLAEEKRTPVGERSMFYRNLPLGDPRRVAWDVGELPDVFKFRMSHLTDIVNAVRPDGSEGTVENCMCGLWDLANRIEQDLGQAAEICRAGKVPNLHEHFIREREEV